MKHLIEQDQEDRLIVLEALYGLSRENGRCLIPRPNVKMACGLDSNRTGRAVQWLVDQGYVRWQPLNSVVMTNEGYNEFERLLAAQEESTHQPNPAGQVHNATHVHIGGDAHNVAIQQAGNGAVQTATIGAPDRDALVPLIAELLRLISAASVPEDKKDAAVADLNTIAAQLKAKEPKRGVIVECWKSARTITENIVAALTASGITTAIPDVVAKVSRMLVL